MKTWHFTIALTVGVYSYVLLPAWVLPMLLTCAYVAWWEWKS